MQEHSPAIGRGSEIPELERPPAYPGKPWKISRSQVRRDAEIFYGGGYRDKPWPRSVYHPFFGWMFNQPMRDAADAAAAKKISR